MLTQAAELLLMQVATYVHLCSQHLAGEDVVERPLHGAQMICVPQALKAQVLKAAANSTSLSKPCKPNLPATQLSLAVPPLAFIMATWRHADCVVRSRDR